MAKGKKGKGKVEMDPAQLAEFRRQQQQLAKAELRRRMEEEAKNNKINGLKILNQWRKIMRLAKTESLKKDIEIISQNHERDVDRKDAILQMLDRDLEEAEEQLQMALRSHLVNMDQLVKLHDTRLYDLERRFQHELKTIQTDFQKERDTLTEKFKNEKRALNAIIVAVDSEEEERENEVKHAFEQLREEIRNRNLEDINMLRISLDAQIEELEQNFETAHLNYLQQTAQRTHDFKELTQNDQRLSAEIDQRRKKIDALQTNIQQWRAKIRTLSRDTEERNRLLLEEKHSIQKHYQQLKQRIQVYRGTQNQRLLQLSHSANQCKIALGEKLDLAKRLLSLSELSHKLQSMSELILPFSPPEVEGLSAEDALTNGKKTSAGATDESERDEEDAFMDGKSLKSLHSDNKKSHLPPAHQSSCWTHKGAAVPHSDRLTNFYRKYNKTLLDSIAIDKEKERLLIENAQLQDLIQQFIDGTKLNESVLASDNPLFVVNGRANLNHVPPVRQINPTVQEGILITNAMSLQVRGGVRR